MGEWKTYTLQQLADPAKHAMATGPFGSAISSRHFTNRGVPVLRGSNLSVDVGHRLIEDDLVFLDESKAKEFVRSQVTQGDLVFTCWGTIGQLGIIDDMARYDRYVVSNKQMKMTPDRSKVNPLFLYYKLSTPQSLWAVQNMAIGSSVPGFNLTQLKSIEVDIPSIEEQQAIVAVLGALDDKIAVNEQIASVYEQILALEFELLGIDIEPGEEVSIRASDLVEFNPKLPPPSREDAVYLDMASLPTSTARVQGWSRRAPKSGTRFSNGDTVMARITPCLENGKTAFVDFMEDGEIGVGSTEFIVMRACPNVPTHFPYFLARSSRFRKIAIQNMVGSSGRQRVSAAQLADVPLARPDRDSLAKFGDRAAAAFAHMKSLGAENQTLAQLRDTLLPKLMSGELRVRDAEKMVEDAT